MNISTKFSIGEKVWFLAKVSDGFHIPSPYNERHHNSTEAVCARITGIINVQSSEGGITTFYMFKQWCQRKESLIYRSREELLANLKERKRY